MGPPLGLLSGLLLVLLYSFPLSTAYALRDQITLRPPPSLASDIDDHEDWADFSLKGSLRDDEGAGHFSSWSKATKESFLADLVLNQADDWTIVIGNEGGDLDSMASALTWAYHLSHLPVPQRAVALLQTEEDALDLRPENSLALHYAAMTSGHRDLLTIDELPVKPFDMFHRIKGLALVDHNVPRAIWGNTTILSIIDHHEDRGLAPSAAPRILRSSGSCSSLVTEVLLDSLPLNPPEALHGPLPVELVELLMRTIAIDTSGLKQSSSHSVDVKSATRLLALSSWRGRKLRGVMRLLNADLSKSKKALDSLDLRDLLRRDWKGDAIPTKSKKYPYITLGFASIPVSMEGQILRTPEQTAPEWFAVERAYTSEVGVDVSVVLTNHRDKDYKKVHEIALVVAHGWGKRLHQHAANTLFAHLKAAIENAPELDNLQEWIRPDGKKLLARRAVWRHWNDEAGRKLLRPIVERAAREWKG